MKDYPDTEVSLVSKTERQKLLEVSGTTRILLNSYLAGDIDSEKTLGSLAGELGLAPKFLTALKKRYQQLALMPSLYLHAVVLDPLSQLLSTLDKEPNHQNQLVVSSSDFSVPEAGPMSYLRTYSEIIKLSATVRRKATQELTKKDDQLAKMLDRIFLIYMTAQSVFKDLDGVASDGVLVSSILHKSIVDNYFHYLKFACGLADSNLIAQIARSLANGDFAEASEIVKHLSSEEVASLKRNIHEGNWGNFVLYFLSEKQKQENFTIPTQVITSLSSILQFLNIQLQTLQSAQETTEA